MASFVPQDFQPGPDVQGTQGQHGGGRRGKRGSALITVILMLWSDRRGCWRRYLTQVETDLRNDRYLKSAFYAAETGLRVGEAVILGTIAIPPRWVPAAREIGARRTEWKHAEPRAAGSGRTDRCSPSAASVFARRVHSTAPLHHTVSGVPDGQVTQARLHCMSERPDDPSGFETDVRMARST
jgi:hypothetical protein